MQYIYIISICIILFYSQSHEGDTSSCSRSVRVSPILVYAMCATYFYDLSLLRKVLNFFEFFFGGEGDKERRGDN